MAPFKRIADRVLRGKRSPGQDLIRRGRAARDAGDLSEAARTFQQAIAHGLDADAVPEAYALLGEAHLGLNEFDEAIAAYTRAVELDPQRRGDWNNLGVAYWSAGRNDQAIQAHQQALRLDPQDANAYCDLGGVYLAMDETHQAIEVLQKSIQLNPDHPVAHANLAVAYAKDRRFDDSYASISYAGSSGYADLYGLKFHVDLMNTNHLLHGGEQERTWLDLLEEAKSEPDNADMTSLRYAYSLSDQYDPYYVDDSIAPWIQEARLADEAGDIHGTIQAATRVLATNYMHLESHWRLTDVYLHVGEDEQAVPHQQFLRSCLRSVYHSGDGQSDRTAYVVVSLDEEYRFLELFGPMEGYQYQGQARYAEHNGHAFDIFEVQHTETGQRREIYFNIDLIRKAVAAGRAELPQAE